MNRRDPNVLDDADILAVADPSDDNTIPRARRPGFLAAKPTLAFPSRSEPLAADSTTRLPPPSRPARATLPPPRLPAHSAWPKSTSTASPFARRVDSQPPFRAVGPLTPVEALRPSDAPPPPVAMSSAAAPPSLRTAPPREATTQARERSLGAKIVWGLSFMGVGAAAAAGVFFLLSRMGAPLSVVPSAPAADPPAAASAAPARPTHEPAVAVGVQKRPQVVTFDDALVVDDPTAPAASGSVALATSAAPTPATARRFRRAAPASKEATPADVLGAALSGSQEPAPTTATATAAAPPAPPPPPAPKSEEPRRPRTPMEALADAQLKSSLK